MIEHTLARHRLRVPALPATALFVCLAATPIRGQEERSVAPGQVVARVVSPTDTTQAYALYIPSNYVGTRSWPLLVIMDPEGQAVRALRPFQAEAERRGWIVISGYGTHANGLAGANVAAVNAMLSDASATFALDSRRIYLAGFSGTARIAWQFAAQLGDRVAGIYGAGAGGTALTRFTEPPPGVAFFGAAGSSDFNYDEVRGLEPWLEDHGVPHRLRFFKGGHEWPPAAVASEAVDWFELKAMQQGREPLREAFVDSLHQEDMIAADSLEAAGRPADALERYRQVLADYGPKAAEAQAAANRLATDPEVKKELERRRQEGYAFEDFMGRLNGWVAELAQSDVLPTPVAGIHILGLQTLEARASAPTVSPEEVASIQRRLSAAHLVLAFYQPRAFLKENQPAKALVVLDVAAVIRDDDPNAFVFRAEAEAALGDEGAALDALERAASLGAPVASFESDPYLQSLRGKGRFKSLVGGG